MPSLLPVDVIREWTAVQAGPFVGRVSSLTGNHTAGSYSLMFEERQ